MKNDVIRPQGGIFADLHLHSVWSDGKETPDALAARCKAAGLALFSITDHDNMGAAAAGRTAAEKYGLLYLDGWEVSAYEGENKVHILGYGCKRNERYRAFLATRAEGSLIRAEDMIAKANAFFGLSLTLEDAERFHRKKRAPLHTMHVVSAFAEALGADKGELYREAFARGGPAFSTLCRPSPEEAIGVIHDLGGVAVLAHPGRMAPEGREELMERLSERGLDGIECFYTTHTLAETEEFLSFARRRGLIVTGGSDFHCEDGVHAVGQPRCSADPRILALL